jgi:hypothetical protein
MKYSNAWGRIADFYTESKPPSFSLDIFVQEEGEALLEIANTEGLILKKINLRLNKGISTYTIDLRVDGGAEAAMLKWTEKLPWVARKGPMQKGGDGFWYLPPSNYEVRISRGGMRSVVPFEIKE